jgi:hypothetical protein
VGRGGPREARGAVEPSRDRPGKRRSPAPLPYCPTWGRDRSKAQDGTACKNALTLVDELKPLFLNAVAKNAALAQQYLGLAQRFDAQNAPAKQAVATRKKSAKAPRHHGSRRSGAGDLLPPGTAEL